MATATPRDRYGLWGHGDTPGSSRGMRELGVEREIGAGGFWGVPPRCGGAWGSRESPGIPEKGDWFPWEWGWLRRGTVPAERGHLGVLRWGLRNLGDPKVPFLGCSGL